jgi:hypothetical protein
VLVCETLSSRCGRAEGTVAATVAAMSVAVQVKCLRNKYRHKQSPLCIEIDLHIYMAVKRSVDKVITSVSLSRSLKKRIWM